jgi:hypothetical protein
MLAAIAEGPTSFALMKERHLQVVSAHSVDVGTTMLACTFPVLSR